MESAPSAEDCRTGNWGDLTQEALVEIISKLDLRDRWKNLSIVCKGWLKAFRDPFLWRELDLEKYFESNRETAFQWSSEFEKRMDRMIKVAVDNSQGFLTKLTVRHCSDDALSYVAKRCPNLEYLSIKACQGVTDASLCEIASGCPLIKELDISYSHNISCSSLEKVGLACKDLIMVKRNMLNTLDPSEIRNVVPRDYIYSAQWKDDEEAACFAKFMPNLRHFDMRFAKLSAKGLNALINGCTQLEHLDLYGCSNIPGREIDNVSKNAKNLKTFTRPNLFYPISAFHVERYGHWRLYDDRFQTNVFQI
eukprot:TRINITY_DN34023_c0_g1_i1.p1 TRINITY_DN34023_c0_g1~~TRINITY_DN34023_c0_g1_i1.p1  ORF type:complete len:308 (+),score=52.13 TRINITY_DN34023_c0_g1_i1:156-1079(+)